MNCLMHWFDAVAIRRTEVETYIDTLFILSSKEEAYAIQVALIVQNGPELGWHLPSTL